MCKSWCELIVAVVILVFALWETTYSKWIIVIAAIVLAIHSFTCKKCFVGHGAMMNETKKKKR